MSEMMFSVSPSFTHDKLGTGHIDDYIDVFEDRFLNWMFKPVEVLMSTQDGHVAAVGILSTYFESIQIYKKGIDSTRRSKEFFTDCFCEIFGTNGDVLSKSAVLEAAKAFYTQGRCGFAHDGLFKNKLFFSNGNPNALIFTYPLTNGKVDTTKPLQSIVANPYRFAELVFNHFENYMAQLRDTEEIELRSKFLKAVSIKWELENEAPLIAMSEEDFLANQ